MRRLLYAVMGALALAFVLPTLGWAQTARQAVVGTTIHGRVVRVAPTTNTFIVQTPEGREVTFYANPQTTYRFNNQAVQFNELREGTTITATYNTQGDRYIANAVTWGDTAPAPGTATRTTTTEQVPPPSGTTTATPAPQTNVPTGSTLEGTILRVQGTDQFIVRTADGKEMVFYAAPQAVYRFDERPATFAEIQQGMPVTITYSMQDGRRPIASTIVGRRRR